MEIINTYDYSLYLKLKNAIDNFDDSKFDYGLDEFGEPAIISCHMLAEAISRIYPNRLRLENGYYHTPQQHSWLVTEHGNILDIYPVGIVSGPLLIDQRSIFSRRTVYVIRESIMDEIRQLPGYYNAVYHIELELRILLDE